MSGTQEKVHEKAVMLAESICILKMMPEEQDELIVILEAAIRVGWDLSENSNKQYLEGK